VIRAQDGINIGFIKDFQEILKGELHRFSADFYRHDKLTRGIKEELIALSLPRFLKFRTLNVWRIFVLSF